MRKLFYPFITVLLLGIFISNSSFGQQEQPTTKQQAPSTPRLARPNYKHAIGIKFVPFAISYKVFQRFRNRAFELLGDFNNGFRVTGLYQFHGDLNGTRNLKFYLGFGGHAGYYDNHNGSTGVMTGVDGVAGLDYKFLHLPINLALDWQPSYEFISPGTEFQGGRGGLAIRFAF